MTVATNKADIGTSPDERMGRPSSSTVTAVTTALTDSSGGTASDTLAAITGGGAGCENVTKNAIASLAAKVEANRDTLSDVVTALTNAGLIK